MFTFPCWIIESSDNICTVFPRKKIKSYRFGVNNDKTISIHWAITVWEMINRMCGFLNRSSGNGGSHDVHASFPDHSQFGTRGLEASHMGLWLVFLVSFLWYFQSHLLHQPKFDGYAVKERKKTMLIFRKDITLRQKSIIKVTHDYCILNHLKSYDSFECGCWKFTLHCSCSGSEK